LDRHRRGAPALAEAHDQAVAEEAGVVDAGGDRVDRRRDADGDRALGRAGAAGAELALAVVAPAPRGAAAGDRAAVAEARGDRGRAGDPGDRPRRQHVLADRGGVELAEVVRAPAQDLAVAGADRARTLEAAGERARGQVR